MEKGTLTEAKAKRIAVGATVAGVLLIFFLLVVLITQFVMIGVRSGEKARLEENIAQLRASNSRDEKRLDDYLNGDGLYILAVMQGWKSR